MQTIKLRRDRGILTTYACKFRVNLEYIEYLYTIEFYNIPILKNTLFKGCLLKCRCIKN